jgi:mRNA interferase MazF
MKLGAVLLARVQQSDGQLKMRPVIVLAPVPPYQDLLVCAVSSQTRHEVIGFDDLILDTCPDFSQSGLKISSLIRLGLVATIPSSAIVGTLGSVSSKRLQVLQRRLADRICPT